MISDKGAVSLTIRLHSLSRYSSKERRLGIPVRASVVARLIECPIGFPQHLLRLQDFMVFSGTVDGERADVQNTVREIQIVVSVLGEGDLLHGNDSLRLSPVDDALEKSVCRLGPATLLMKTGRDGF